MTPTSDALLPCPFCGGSSIHLQKAVYGYGHALECETCGAFLSSDAEPPDNSAEIVRKAWNRRASAPASPAIGVQAVKATETRKLIDCINALLDLDARGALHPHGIGGLARELFKQALLLLSSLEAALHPAPEAASAGAAGEVEAGND